MAKVEWIRLATDMFENKKIFILGMARSGYEAAKVLAKHNCKVLVTDMKWCSVYPSMKPHPFIFFSRYTISVS